MLKITCVLKFLIWIYTHVFFFLSDSRWGFMFSYLPKINLPILICFQMFKLILFHTVSQPTQSCRNMTMTCSVTHKVPKHTKYILCLNILTFFFLFLINSTRYPIKYLPLNPLKLKCIFTLPQTHNIMQLKVFMNGPFVVFWCFWNCDSKRTWKVKHVHLPVRWVLVRLKSDSHFTFTFRSPEQTKPFTFPPQ